MKIHARSAAVAIATVAIVGDAAFASQEALGSLSFKFPTLLQLEICFFSIATSVGG